MRPRDTSFRRLSHVRQRTAAHHAQKCAKRSRMTEGTPTFIEVGRGATTRRIAVRRRSGSSPGLFWLGGFKSDMQGTKAAALDRFAADAKRACVRFDYSGHGESGGAFEDGTIGQWLEDSVAAYAGAAQGPQILVGSSMGGWIALLLIRELQRRAGAGQPLAPVAGL